MSSQKQQPKLTTASADAACDLLRAEGHRILQEVCDDPGVTPSAACVDLVTLQRLIEEDMAHLDPRWLHIMPCAYCYARMNSMLRQMSLHNSREKLIQQLAHESQPKTRAAILHTLYAECGCTREELAALTKRPIAEIKTSIAYGAMPREIQDAIDSKDLTVTHAMVLCEVAHSLRLFYGQTAMRLKLSAAGLKRFIKSPFGRLENDTNVTPHEKEPSSQPSDHRIIIPCPSESGASLMHTSDGPLFVLTKESISKRIRIVVAEDVPFEEAKAWFEGVMQALAKIRAAFVDSRRKGTSIKTEILGQFDGDTLHKHKN